MKKTFPVLLLGFGVLSVLFFLLADFFGLGKAGIQAAQIFGMEIGAFFILAGFVLRSLKGWGDFSVTKVVAAVRDLPDLTWVALGSLPAFILYLLVPMFFHESHRIQYPVDYIRQIVPIGIDFQSMIGAIELWLKSGEYGQYMFAPLVNLLFAPLMLFKYPTSYYILTFVTLASYLILCLLALKMSRVDEKSIVVFISAISIFSYGLVFEFERGQTYTISLMLSVLAVYLFHYQRDLRWLAYLLFCVSVQLKFYPALFVLLFVDDWRDWKNTLIRFAVLGLANFLLLFIFGFPYISAFYEHLVNGVQTGEPSVVNHSIQSFVYMLSSPEWGVLKGDSALWVAQYSGPISTVLYVYFLMCFGVVLAGAWVKHKTGFNPNLLLACVLGSLLLPSVNHDYTLAMLSAPVAMSFAMWNTRDVAISKALNVFLTFVASFAYATLLIPHVFKPLYLKNSLPLLFILLTILALQTFNQKHDWGTESKTS